MVLKGYRRGALPISPSSDIKHTDGNWSSHGWKLQLKLPVPIVSSPAFMATRTISAFISFLFFFSFFLRQLSHKYSGKSYSVLVKVCEQFLDPQVGWITMDEGDHLWSNVKLMEWKCEDVSWCWDTLTHKTYTYIYSTDNSKTVEGLGNIDGKWRRIIQKTESHYRICSPPLLEL